MLICFYDSKGIIHKAFVPTGQKVNAMFYIGVLKRLVSRIRQILPEYREEGSWRIRLIWHPATSTCSENAIPKDDLKKSFDNLLDHANRCIQCQGDYFEGDQ